MQKVNIFAAQMQLHVNLHALELEVQNLIYQIEMTNFDIILLFSKSKSSHFQNTMHIFVFRVKGFVVYCTERNFLVLWEMDAVQSKMCSVQFHTCTGRRTIQLKIDKIKDKYTC